MGTTWLDGKAGSIMRFECQALFEYVANFWLWGWDGVGLLCEILDHVAGI